MAGFGGPGGTQTLIAAVVGGAMLLGGGYALFASGRHAEPLRLAEPGTPPQSSASARVAPLLRLGGSNTIGDKLAPALAAGWLKSLGCASVQTSSPKKDETIVACTLNGKLLSVTVSAHGTATGFDGLGAGRYDIAMASDKVDADQTAKLAAVGDMGSASAEHVIGFDGVAVLVNRGNSVSQLTLAQLSALFGGRVTDWAQVGGTSGPVHVVARDEKSGTWKFFERQVLKPGSLSLPLGTRRFEKGSELADAVASDPAAIGFVGAGSTEVAKVLPIKAAEGGVALAPNSLTIRTQDYLLSRRLYLYVPPNHTSPDASRFLAFIDSPAGQDIVKATPGFVPLTLVASKQEVPANAPQAYAAATNDASKLNFTYRFESGQSRLDNLATADLKHLADFIAATNLSPQRLMLVGFTDNQGSGHYDNKALSIRRARSVADQLETNGVRVGAVTGFGEALPVAPNDTDEGRNRNRRVEIWVRP